MAPVRILGVFAHPDDEVFCAGGTFAMLADQGCEVTVLTATRGESGQIREAGVATRRTLPQVREAELRRACDVLGVTRLRVLDHVDGALATVDEQALAGEVLEEIRATQPDVVVTFGP